MASPEYVYGGNGTRERFEYASLGPYEQRQQSEAATVLIDAFFSNACSVEGARHFAEQDKNSLIRSLELSYFMTAKHSDDTLLVDSNQAGVWNIESLGVTYEKKVTIYHESHRSGGIEDSYYIIFENRLPFMSNQSVFLTAYQLEFFRGNTALATVRMNNIEVNDGIEGDFYDRAMVNYDFTALYRELHEAALYIEASDIEQNIDLYLASPIQ